MSRPKPSRPTECHSGYQSLVAGIISTAVDDYLHPKRTYSKGQRQYPETEEEVRQEVLDFVEGPLLDYFLWPVGVDIDKARAGILRQMEAG